MYAKKLTKADLMENGITEVTIDGHVFKGEQEQIPTINKEGYLVYYIYDKDDEGNKIKIPKSNSAFGYVYKQRWLGLHRLMWAWHYGECPDGMVVDHISNCHDDLEDYHLDNLQLMTPGENLAKERPNWNIREIKCRLDVPRSYFETKLEGYLLAYEQAKEMKDAKGAHSLRSKVSQTRARLRYYDSHIAEAISIREKKAAEEARKREYHERAQKRRALRAEADSMRKMYQELLEAYGKDDPIVYEYWGKWKLAVAMYQGFCAENKTEL